MGDFLVKLLELGKLKAGWDGRGSAAITDEAIATAKNLTPCPLGHGGLQIDLHAGGVDLEVEIAPDGQVISVMMTRAHIKTEDNFAVGGGVVANTR